MTTRDVALLVRRNLGRRPLRTLLTIAGVALSITLFVGIESFGAGMTQALEAGDKARTLVVYRKNRYCPQTSYLPERYVEEIASVPGVVSVLPVKVFLNNCRTNLDMITFHGTPVATLLAARDITLTSGDVGRFKDEPDAALVGAAFARRRGLTVGDKFRFGEITVKVAGVFSSADPVEEGLILTHLEFLQRAGPVSRLGTVTQFDVRVSDPAQTEAIAAEIDRRLAHVEEPTQTRSMSAFLARATRDLREILRFGRVFGASCVLVMMVLVANTIYMSVHERRRELGVLMTLGFRARQLVGLMLAESFALALTGGLIGLGIALVLIRTSGIAIGVEGVPVTFAITPSVVIAGVVVTLAAALAASSVPAWQVARLEPVRALRSVA